MPFEEEALSLFIDVALNENGVFILLIDFGEFESLRVGNFLIEIGFCINERGFEWFFKKINFKEVILAFFNLPFHFLYHLQVRLAILLKWDKFLGVNRWMIGIPVVFIEDRGWIVAVKNAEDFIFGNLFHFLKSLKLISLT